jgi:hypothetical protein
VAKQRANDWHPLVRDVVSALSGDAGCPVLDEQLATAARVAALDKKERTKVVTQLRKLARRFADANEDGAARFIESIAFMSEAAEESLYAAQRWLT